MLCDARCRQEHDPFHLSVCSGKRSARPGQQLGRVTEWDYCSKASWRNTLNTPPSPTQTSANTHQHKLAHRAPSSRRTQSSVSNAEPLPLSVRQRAPRSRNRACACTCRALYALGMHICSSAEVLLRGETACCSAQPSPVEYDSFPINVGPGSLPSPRFLSAELLSHLPDLIYCQEHYVINDFLGFQVSHDETEVAADILFHTVT